MEEFLSLIVPSPAIKVLEVTSDNFLTDALYVHLKKCDDAEYAQSRYGGVYNGYDSDELLHVDEIDSLSKPFKGKNREYEYLILNSIVTKHAYVDRVVKLAYSSLENSAYIIVVEKKEDTSQEALIELLDRHEFRAVNAIDIFEDRYVVMGKKLHMWGNGQ